MEGKAREGVEDGRFGPPSLPEELDVHMGVRAEADEPPSLEVFGDLPLGEHTPPEPEKGGDQELVARRQVVDRWRRIVADLGQQAGPKGVPAYQKQLARRRQHP